MIVLIVLPVFGVDHRTRTGPVDECVQGARMGFHVGASGQGSLGHESESYECQKFRSRLWICGRVEAPCCLPPSHDVAEESAERRLSRGFELRVALGVTPAVEGNE
jgi:hypothetical protein